MFSDYVLNIKSVTKDGESGAIHRLGQTLQVCAHVGFYRLEWTDPHLLTKRPALFLQILVLCHINVKIGEKVC